MPFRFNMLLQDAGIEPSSVRLLRHQDNRSAKGRSPYELWRDNRPAFEEYQRVQTFSNRAKLQAPYWASFVVTSTGETLFAGLYSCQYSGINEADISWPHAPGTDAAGTRDVYALQLDPRFEDLQGRLVIEWGLGGRAWIQRADFQEKAVAEIWRSFREPEFPGFTEFMADLSSIERLPATWSTALSAVKGVYLLTCPRTKEQYVGSATGADGFFGRWLTYRDGHGGNVGLKSRDPSDYRVSILEVAGDGSLPEDILAKESLWKRKLQSGAMGLNRN